MKTFGRSILKALKAGGVFIVEDHPAEAGIWGTRYRGAASHRRKTGLAGGQLYLSITAFCTTLFLSSCIAFRSMIRLHTLSSRAN
jgi:hypothetical protein